MTLNFVLSRNSYEARHLPELDQGDGSFPRHIELVKLVKTHVGEDGYIRFDFSQLDIYIQLKLQAITLYHPTTFQPNLTTNMRAVSVIGVLATIISYVYTQSRSPSPSNSSQPRRRGSSRNLWLPDQH